MKPEKLGMNWSEEGQNEEEDLTCPFCGETGFDKIGLKNHLEFWCDE